MGVAALQLGTFVRQSTLSVSVQVNGRSWAAVVLPFRLGPRHCGQFAASAAKAGKLRPKTRFATLRREWFILPSVPPVEAA
jgi:hypothetical protein